jgi:hypothetical protein
MQLRGFAIIASLLLSVPKSYSFAPGFRTDRIGVILLNEELWMHCDADDQMHIMRHWIRSFSLRS